MVVRFPDNPVARDSITRYVTAMNLCMLASRRPRRIACMHTFFRGKVNRVARQNLIYGCGA